MHRHSERRIVPYTPQQLYDLVVDIEAYPKFLPWCVGARIRQRSERLIVADLIIGYRLFREHFTSRVELDPGAEGGPRIDVEYADGPFKHLDNHWHFKPHPDGCEIDFFVEFAFKSRLLDRALELLFSEAVKRMVGAFEKRAAVLYGPAAATAPR